MISKNVENMIPKIQQPFALDSVNNDKFLIYERKS